MEPKELIAKLNKYRKDNQIFQKSVIQRSEKNQIITYDGPPFASGSPHFGHGLTSTMKDTIGRYKTMQGYRVVRNRGRDCHGLPVEKYVEKTLGIDGKKDIEKMGVEKFIEACRTSVQNTNDEWKWFVDTLGRRADMDHAYFTMDLDFMESVMRVFQNMYNRNLVYKGFKIQGYCPSCATGLSNSEISDGYKDRQDPAITVKFPIYIKNTEDKEIYETTDFEYIKSAKGVIKDEKGRILLLYHGKFDVFMLPGGRIDKGETTEITLSRELKEELGIEVKNSKLIGGYNVIQKNVKKIWFHSVFDVEINGIPKNLETNKHPQMVWAETIESENELGFAIKIEDTIVDDKDEIISKFNGLYAYKLNIAGEIGKEENTPINILARTTTPRTLPSNMFLATGKDLKYAMVFDKNAKEYYILAKDLVKNYYKNPEDFILVNIFDGGTLKGFSYRPLFDYIPKSSMADEYKNQLFQIINGDFVSLESGTGVVHLAPAFGVDDFEAVSQVFPREKAKERLFLPVDEYGDFTDEVPDYKGIRVYDANKEIIKKLKSDPDGLGAGSKLIYQNTYEHSYPHCRRCDTPLIYKAMEARFIKENEISADSIKNLDQINFVPETVKNRFADVLKTAPDWNVSRNRYRGAPLPIWESINNLENRLVVGNLDELFQLTKTGSNNITKNIFIRHGETDYNETKKHDSYGNAVLNQNGKKQSEELEETLKNNFNLDDDFVIVISPLKRTFETIVPFLRNIYDEKEVEHIEKKYDEITKNYKKLRDERKIIENTKKNSDLNFFEINDKIFVDFRITDNIVKEFQDQQTEHGWTRKQPIEQAVKPGSESVLDGMIRVGNYIEFANKKFKGKTIITVSHKDAIVAMIKKFRDFDFLTKKNMYSPANCEIKTYYRDNERKMEVDLHKPYIDSYRFEIDNEMYHRIPDVLDCWFESGAMPYGQSNYTGKSLNKSTLLKNGGMEEWRNDGILNNSSISQGKKNSSMNKLNYGHFDSFNPLKLRGKLPYPADYIIEGLDQTRGWFRTLHVLGNGIMGENSFKNVVINGLVLAEDGKKMSKKLKNYPDPEYLFNKYGSDSYRLYLLNSPAVRAEPVRFTEKGVEQVSKDFCTALNNTYKFFETYAKVDNFKFSSPEIFFIRHAKAEGIEQNAKITKEGIDDMNNPSFIQKILKINPDVIYCSNISRAKDTAEVIQKHLKEYTGKKIDIIEEEKFGIKNECLPIYQNLIENTSYKKILIVAHNYTLREIRAKYYGQDIEELPKNGNKMINNLEFFPLPNYKIASDLDKRMLSELHTLIEQIENAMEKYYLDQAAKVLLGFIDKLNNRYIRRSRRRFRGSGMDTDKLSAYHTLFEVLQKFLVLTAPFAPFISEDIRLKLNNFKKNNSDSIHLEYFPISSVHYINKDLIQETDLVRRIISLGLFVRAKNKVKIKQPLSKMEVRV